MRRGIWEKKIDKTDHCFCDALSTQYICQTKHFNCLYYTLFTTSLNYNPLRVRRVLFFALPTAFCTISIPTEKYQ